MKIILAPDSFKECLSAVQVCRALETGVRRALPQAVIISLPLADGGEGTVEALVSAVGGELRTQAVIGPNGEPVTASWGMLRGDTAVIEMAAAAGLALVPPEKRNPLHTTAFGFGQVIRAALDAGAKTLLLGIGGSATNDCGLGMAQALGTDFYDENGRIDAPLTGGDMARITRIDIGGMDRRLATATVRVACDVDNPLLGPRGAAYVYGPQKGATPEIVERLEAGASHVIDLLEAQTRPVRNLPGAGAAGGMGAGLCALMNAQLLSGVDLVLDAYRFDEKLAGADLILTGEGKIDEQTAMGKTVSGVLKRAARAGVPVIALAGAALEGGALFAQGLTSLFSICDRPMSLQESMSDAERLIAQATERVVRVFSAARA